MHLAFEAESTSEVHLCELEVAVDEGPLQELLDGGNADLVFLVHEDLVEVTVLDLLSC